MCKESDVCEANHDWRDDIPIPDDLWVEKLFLMNRWDHQFQYARPFLVDEDTPEYFVQYGVTYQAYPYDPDNW